MHDMQLPGWEPGMTLVPAAGYRAEGTTETEYYSMWRDSRPEQGHMNIYIMSKQ